MANSHFSFFFKEVKINSNMWNNIFERTLKSLQPNRNMKFPYKFMGQYSFKWLF